MTHQQIISLCTTLFGDNPAFCDSAIEGMASLKKHHAKGNLTDIPLLMVLDACLNAYNQHVPADELSSWVMSALKDALITQDCYCPGSSAKECPSFNGEPCNTATEE